MVSRYIEVEVDLSDFSTNDLQAELESREDNDRSQLDLEKLYDIKRYRPELFDEAFSRYCWNVLGKNV